jgi:glycerol-3-phosphate dehydrogenase
VPLKTDVLIIGGGAAGNAIARELSRYEGHVTLVEKEADVGWGQTKASYAIRHPGARWAPGTLAQSMIAKSNKIFDRLIEELDIDFRKLGELVLAFDRDEMAALKAMQKQGEHIGVTGLEIIDGAEVQRLEPHLNPAAIAALHIPMAGVFNPFELVYALHENAKENGVRMLLNAEVLGIAKDGEEFVIETQRDEIHTQYVVNAAGLHAEEIAVMAEADNFKIAYDTKSTCFVVDKSLGDAVSRIVTGLTDLQAYTRFKLVTPTYSGNILIYTPISEPAHGIDDRAVEERSLDLTLESVRSLVPDADFENHLLTAFSGLTARNDRGDFIIEASPRDPRFINVAIPPPGITCCPAIGDRVVALLKENGLNLNEKTGFNPYRRAIRSLRNSPAEEMGSLIGGNPHYGKVACRCEEVTEGEIKEAVRRGASTLDGIKFRTRAGMGRCQGNFCGPHLTAFLSETLNRPMDQITKKGPGSPYVIGAG